MRIPLRSTLLALVIAAPALAQAHGEVRDSTTGQAVSGAIVMVLDSAGRTLARNISNESGRYLIALPATSQRLRFVRIGFKPREVALAGPGATLVNVAMAPIPTFLQTVTVTAAAGCPARADRAQALALYEQARVGLLATVVAREANPAHMVLYSYERTMAGTSNRITSHSVRVDSSSRAKVSFSAIRNAAEFVKNGFVVESASGQVFHAPDADVLLSNAFASAYCFGIAKPDRERPNQLGLAFEAGQHKRDRIDIEGALWIDTVARALTAVEFNYVGLGRRMEMYEPGGLVEFREMPNGAVLVDRWKLRLIGTLADTVSMKSKETGPRVSTVRVTQYAAESGGELARARWPDGKTWRARLGALRVRALNARGEPAVGAVVALDDSPYSARADSSGIAEFTDIIAGPYSLVVRDPALSPIGVVMPTTVSFAAVRDSTHAVDVRVPTASDFIFARCLADRRSSAQDSTRFIARVMTYTGEPLGHVNWKVSRRNAPGPDSGSTQTTLNARVHNPPVMPSNLGLGASLGAWQLVRDAGRTGTDGMFQICTGGLYRGVHLLIQTSLPGYQEKSFEVTLTDALQVIRLDLSPRP